MAIPPEYEPHNLDDSAFDAFTSRLNDFVTTTAVVELGVPVRIVSARWMVTCHAGDIDDLPYLEDCPNGYACGTCNEGRRQAKVYLATHPGEHIAVGLLSFALAHDSTHN